MSGTATIKMTVQYDGSAYHGYQKQKGGIATVQSSLEEALGKLLGRPIEIVGASRTDAGVHALGQVVSFSVESNIPPDRMAPALSPLLPPTISAVHSERKPVGFNARFDAKAKTYHYLCYEAKHAVPFYRHYALNVPCNFDAAKAAAAMERFVGTHDFTAFENQGSSQRDSVKTISAFEIERFGPFIKFQVTGTGFLYKMVRNMVGAAIEAGLGRMTPEGIDGALRSGRRELAGPTLPPQGLYLIRVLYGGEGEKIK